MATCGGRKPGRRVVGVEVDRLKVDRLKAKKNRIIFDLETSTAIFEFEQLEWIHSMSHGG